MDSQLNSILDLYTIGKDVMFNDVQVSGIAPEINRWQQFLTRYVKVITSGIPEDIPEEYYPQFIDWIELMSTHRFHRLWSQKKRFDAAMNVYHELYSNLPDKIVLCSYRLLLFQGIVEQFLIDLRATGLPIGLIVNPCCKDIYGEIQCFVNQILFLIVRNNKYFSKTSKLVFHPCLDVHAILSTNPINLGSPVVLAIGPNLVKRLLSPTPCSIFSHHYSIDTNIYDIDHAQGLLKQALSRLIELQIDDYDTFFCLTKGSDTAKCLLPIEYLMIKIGFIPEICRAMYIYKETIEVDGKILSNAPDTVYFSLTEMLIRDAHTHPAIFCWIARMIDLALDAPPTITAAKEGLDVTKIKTVPMSCCFFTHQNKIDLNLNFTCFLAEKRHGLTTQSIYNELISRDSSKLFSDHHIYRFHLTHGLPYATLTKYASALAKAYLYLRLVDGYALDEISFNDVDDIYETISNPKEFYSRLTVEKYAPSKFLTLVKERHPKLDFAKINKLFISIELQLIRGINLPQGLSEKYFKEGNLLTKKGSSASKEYISLEDPISRARIKVPVRGCSCKHVACFDLETFISYSCNTDTWDCPMCAETIGLSTLYIDAYQYAILNYLAILGHSDRKILIDSETLMPVFSSTGENDDSVLSDWVDN